MKLIDILDAVHSNNGAAVDRRELEHALLVMESLLTFSRQDFDHVYQARTKKQLGILFEVGRNEQLRRVKAALDKSPTDWLGPDNLPELPEYQKRRAMAFKIFEAAAAKGGE